MSIFAPPAPPATVSADDVVTALRVPTSPGATITPTTADDGTVTVDVVDDGREVSVTVAPMPGGGSFPLVKVTVKRGPLTSSHGCAPEDAPGSAAGAYARLVGGPTCGWCARALPHGSRNKHCDRSHASAAQNRARAEADRLRPRNE